MQAYKNLKLVQKLISSFLIVALISLIIGIVGINGMSRLSEEDEEMYQYNTLSMGDLAVMFDTLASQRICMNNMVIFRESNPTFAAEEAESLVEKEELFDQSLASWGKSLSVDDGGTEAAYHAKIKDMYNNEFAAVKTKVRNAVTSGNESLMSTAIKDMDDMGAEISGYMDEAFSHNDTLASGKVTANKALYTQRSILLIVVIAIGIVISILLAVYISTIISKPVGRVLVAAKQVGELGSLNFTPELIESIQEDALSRDEIGQMAAAFAKMMDSLIEKTKILDQVSSGDLTPEVRLISDQDTIGISIRQMLENLNSMFSEINLATEQVSTGSAQIATGAQSLAQATTEQSATVDQLSRSVGNIAAKTQSNAELAEQAARLANSIKDSAEQGAGQMSRMISAVSDINESSRAISTVIKVIDDIAFQTNILALNAAVEAARAGVHGKGFAVVAEEVRNLASKSAEAAKDTGSLIEASVEKAELGARIAGETSAALDTIVAGVAESTTIMGNIARSSDEQNHAITEINKGIDEVIQVVQQNSATAEESAAASEEMSGQSAMLKSLVERFKLRDSGFGKPALQTHYGQSAYDLAE